MVKMLYTPYDPCDNDFCNDSKVSCTVSENEQGKWVVFLKNDKFVWFAIMLWRLEIEYFIR